ncbi:beta-glucanase-like protein [Leptotrombidium deliense]|uniref:Beta-glucanase-like protein n=1 Tax=Leptotrombidium deliense TaxID=299467 RepID=A0A443RTG7_9ACAR|nr:beta-glucanase-like protein [Leptotrombidium deliense]
MDISPFIISFLQLIWFPFKWTPTGHLIFQETFSGSTLNKTIWEVQTGHKTFGKTRLQCYREDNVIVNDSLTIQAKYEEVKCQENDGTTIDLKYTSARIRTRREYKFSAIEIEARTSNGAHLQPALWTQKSDSEMKFTKRLT